MPCYHPLRAFSGGRTEDGKQRLVWNRRDGRGVPVYLPCGQCIGCRLEKARQWAVRCMHEADTHEANCFITLTYDDEHLPCNGGLVFEDFQAFMKRLRKRYGKGIRFYHSGEYGEEFGRPHYHALLFGFDFPDKVLLKEHDGCKLYSSESLTQLWGKGMAVIGALTFESAAYVARYVMKKVTGKNSGEHYGGRCPEYSTMSRRPGIGGRWIAEYWKDVYPSDGVIVRGKECKPPRFYDKYVDKMYPDVLQVVKDERIRKGSELEAVPVRSVWNGEKFVRGVVWLPRSDPSRLSRLEKLEEARRGLYSRRSVL